VLNICYSLRYRDEATRLPRKPIIKPEKRRTKKRQIIRSRLGGQTLRLIELNEIKDKVPTPFKNDEANGDR